MKEQFRGMAFRAVRIVLVLLAWGTFGWAQETMQVVQNMPGFKPEMAYKDFGNGESVNLANGNLVITHASALSLPEDAGCTAPHFLDTDKHQAASGVKTWVRASAGVRKPSRSMRQWLLYC